jgi:hypothetical protein
MWTFSDSHPPGKERPSVELSENGWEYAESGIAAVGARDITLGEATNPLLLGRPGEEPEAVVLRLTEIIEDSRLNWVLQNSTQLEGGDEPRFEVSWAVWQEHAGEPIAAWLPECDATGIDRLLAIAERDVRFAKQKLDAAGAARQRLVVLASRLGRSRREVGETLGLSTGRVQQLNDDPPAEVVGDVEGLIRAAVLIGDRIGNTPCPRDGVPPVPGLGGDERDEAVDLMLALGLLEEADGEVRLTNDGSALVTAALGAGASGKARTGSAKRERVSDATQ